LDRFIDKCGCIEAEAISVRACLISKMIVRADNANRGDEHEGAAFKQARAEGIVHHPVGMRRDAASGNEKIGLIGDRPPVLAQ